MRVSLHFLEHEHQTQRVGQFLECRVERDLRKRIWRSTPGLGRAVERHVTSSLANPHERSPRGYAMDPRIETPSAVESPKRLWQPNEDVLDHVLRLIA